jgi:hypothetical protein
MIGYFTDLAEAETYFSDERLETASWDALSDGTGSGTKDEKTAVLKQAYNRIIHCRDFSLPTPSDATAAQLTKLTQAQAETAYYLAQHLKSEDTRKGLHAQGVVGAGVVKENYAESMLKTLPLPAIVYELLEEFETDTTPFFAADIDRDEDYSVDEDVTDLL